MKNQYLKLSFSKDFFAIFLHVQKSDIKYMLMKYEDEETCIYIPAIAVKNIHKYYFNIYVGEFLFLGENMSLVPTKIKKYKDRVIFQSEGKNVYEVKLPDFYRHYMTKIANTLLS